MNTIDEYSPTYEYGAKKSAELEEYGYRKSSNDYGSGAAQLKAGNLDDQLEMKYSMVEDEGYNVEWDPEILADLQANIHQK